MRPPDPAARGALVADVARASRLVGPTWPLERFVAVNPLVGLLDLGFEAAIGEARTWLGIRGYLDAPPAPPSPLTQLAVHHGLAVAREVDDLVADWCAQLVVEGSGPGSVFAHWLVTARGDPRLRRLVGDGGRSRAAFDAVPVRPDDAILAALDQLGIDDDDRTREVRGQLARSPGWASYATWCDEWAEVSDPSPRLARIELLAIRLTTDALVATATGDAGTASSVAAPEDVTPWRRRLAADEGSYRQHLLALLDRPTPAPSELRAQAVFCIDVRSEALRRAFEARGPYDTLGFAGFFATPIRFRPLGSAESYPSAPVLIQPDAEIVERAAPSAGGGAVSGQRRRMVQKGRRRTAAALAGGAGAMYGWAEATGWMEGPGTLARTVQPGWRRGRPAEATVIDTEGAFSTDEGVTLVETALKTMGLTSAVAPIVVVCGHRATTTANPHAAALDCGACGGNPGGPNARTFATMANDPVVRDALTARGIAIPDTTLFVAAEHDTTIDTITLLDEHLIPPDRRDEVATVAADLEAAGQQVAAAKVPTLPGAAGRRSPRDRARRRAADWSQVRAEWGLAGNAAMVVAPRDLTRGVDLEGRVFLHSYDDRADTDGVALETILTAPMVVAHWINAQYYFSSVDPEVYGCGDKALHNPIGGVGVLAGAGGDLRIGLPWQSVGVGERLHHQPLRLLTTVAAPRERVDAVIERNPILGQLFDGAWVHLAVRDRRDPSWQLRRPGGGWCPHIPASQGATP